MTHRLIHPKLITCADCHAEFYTAATNYAAVKRCPECQRLKIKRTSQEQGILSYQRYRAAKARGEVREVKHQTVPQCKPTCCRHYYECCAIVFTGAPLLCAPDSGIANHAADLAPDGTATNYNLPEVDYA